MDIVNVQESVVVQLLLGRAPPDMAPVVRRRLATRPTWVHDARQCLRKDGHTWRAEAARVLAPLYAPASFEEAMDAGADAHVPSIRDLGPREAHALACKAAEHLRAELPRLPVRILDTWALEGAIQRHVAHVRTHEGRAHVHTELAGGVVAKPLNYVMRADRFEVRTDPDGATTWHAWRGRAPHRPGHSAWHGTVRVIPPGYVKGTIVARWGLSSTADGLGLVRGR